MSIPAPGCGYGLRDAHPLRRADARAWRLASETYDAVGNAAVGPLPTPPGTAPTNLRRRYLETDAATRVDIETFLDEVATADGFGVLAGHSAWDAVTSERVAFAIEATRERGIELTTVGRVAGSIAADAA